MKILTRSGELNYIINPGTQTEDFPRGLLEIPGEKSEKAEIQAEIAKNQKKAFDKGGLYLSEIIKFLCNKEPNKLITIVVSAILPGRERVYTIGFS